MFALVSGLVALVFYPIVRACVLGQMQLALDLFYLCAYFLRVLGRKASCGLVWSAWRPLLSRNLGCFCTWAILWREWKFVRGFILGFAAPLP